jgi:outer membrane protein assembly factor BamB
MTAGERMTQNGQLFIGLYGTVLALDRTTGAEIWRSNLKGCDFVNVVFQQKELYATTKGHIFRLDPGSGQIMWHNSLKGMGSGIVSVAGQDSTSLGEQRRRAEAAAAAAAT